MRQPVKLRNRALITGGSRGLGRAIAWRLHQEGFLVAVNHRNSAPEAEAVVDQIRNDGGRAVAIQGDVAQPDDVIAVFNEAEQALGGLDVLVNNAGVSPAREHIENFLSQHFDEILQVNLKGAFHCMREAARRFGDGGRIISISSSTVTLDAPGAGPYAASKAGLERLTKILAKELAGRNITVNAVSPGLAATDLALSTNTPEQIEQIIGMTPLGRLGAPDDVAAAVAFLASDDAAFVNGAVLSVNGGLV